MGKDVLKTEELHIIDSNGVSRIVLSADDESAAIKLIHPESQATTSIELNSEGFPSIRLHNPDQSLPMVVLEVDKKGSHLKFSHPNGANTYLFLNNESSSGLVVVNQSGERSYQILVNEKGEVKIKDS